MVYDYPHFHNDFLHVVCFNQPNLGDDFGLVTLAVQVILALIIFIAFSSEHHKKAWVKWLHPGVKWVSPWLGTSWGHLKRTKTGRPCLEPLRPRRIQLASRIDPAGAQGLGFGRSTCQVAKHFCKNHGHLRASEGLRVPPSKTPQQIKAYHIHLKHSKTPYHGLSEQLKTHGFPAFFRSDSPPPGLWASQLSATLLRAGRTSQDVAGVQGWNDAFTMLSMEKPSKSSKVVEKMGILHGIRWNMSGIFKNYDFKCNGG